MEDPLFSPCSMGKKNERNTCKNNIEDKILNTNVKREVHRYRHRSNHVDRRFSLLDRWFFRLKRRDENEALNLDDNLNEMFSSKRKKQKAERNYEESRRSIRPMKTTSILDPIEAFEKVVPMINRRVFSLRKSFVLFVVFVFFEKQKNQLRMSFVCFDGSIEIELIKCWSSASNLSPR